MHIREGQMIRNDAGEAVADAWVELPRRFPSMGLDMCVVMPNHLHGILSITLRPGAAGSAPMRSSPTLGVAMGAFKSTSAITVNCLLSRTGQQLWQRGFYDRVIRNEDELNKIREYIATNPLRWGGDRENPDRTETDSSDDEWNW